MPDSTVFQFATEPELIFMVTLEDNCLRIATHHGVGELVGVVGLSNEGLPLPNRKIRIESNTTVFKLASLPDFTFVATLSPAPSKSRRPPQHTLDLKLREDASGEMTDYFQIPVDGVLPGI